MLVPRYQQYTLDAMYSAGKNLQKRLFWDVIISPITVHIYGMAGVGEELH